MGRHEDRSRRRSVIPQSGVPTTSEHRRAHTLRQTLAITGLGAVLPGAGYLWTGRRVLGLLVLAPSVLIALGAGWYVVRDHRTLWQLAVDPDRLRVAAAVAVTVAAVWMVVVVTTYLLVRPARRSRAQTMSGVAFTGALCVLLAAPTALSVRYATIQADLISAVFEDNVSATVPRAFTGEVPAEDPWAGQDRVNVLLLGGDGNVHRDGVRTDSLIVMSMDTDTGETVMFSLPRNLMNARFPADTPLHDLYPDGFNGAGDPAAYMLNAVYGQVPVLHPGVLGRSDNEGADAVKLAVEGTLGLPVHYYVLVNLMGFRDIVDAMGGVTVNINQPVPVGGRPELNVPPTRYLEPGPGRRLDGVDARWFARGRYGSDDYQRMERQRCLVRAVIDEMRPLTLLRNYQELAATGEEVVRSDIPSDLLPAFVDLGLLVKDADVRSVVFRSSERFFPGDPDIPWMQGVVERALGQGPRAPRRRDRPAPGAATDTTASCAYDPGP
ncbi:MAG: LCP family protein [Nocardioides sp.]